MTQTGLGKILKALFKGIDWEMHHVYIQQAWSRGGLYDDVMANEGLRRIGNGLWNLLPIPGSLNSLLGRCPEATQLLATAYYSFIVYGSEDLLAVIIGD